MKRLVALVFATMIMVVSAPTVATGQSSGKKNDGGLITVELNGVDGVGATVMLDGRQDDDFIAIKPTTGTTSTTKLSVPLGSYKPIANPVIVDGIRYEASLSRPEVVVNRPKPTTTLTVDYQPDGGAQRLHATSVDQNNVSLAWVGVDAGRYVVRRSFGDQPVQDPDSGVDVPVDGVSASDTGLVPGETYTYSLFTKLKAGSWIGPHWITVGTTNPAAENDTISVAYVKTSSTLLAEPEQIISTAIVGGGVQVVLADDVPVRSIGSAIVLPHSDLLPGGYIGEVVDVDSDGRTVTLVHTGIEAAFDYYSLDIPSLAEYLATQDGGVDPSGVLSSAAGGGAGGFSGTLPTSAYPQLPAVPAAPSMPLQNQLVSCLNLEGGNSISFDPDLIVDAYLGVEIDKQRVWFVEVPAQATVDVGVTATAVLSMDIETFGALTCELTLDQFEFYRPFMAGPVPMLFTFEPAIELEAGGGWTASNVGYSVTSGFTAETSFGWLSENYVNLDTFGNVTELNSVVTQASGAIQLKLGGGVAIGPGTGAAQAGVLAGIQGELFPLQFSVEVIDDLEAGFCVIAGVGTAAQVDLVAKAWLGAASVEYQFGLWDGYNPWFETTAPGDCENDLDDDITDDVAGEGIDVVDSDLVGSDVQVGYLEGFVPGDDTWVLSTGLISEAIGQPSFFASTSLGRPGDSALSASVGLPTFDAVRYTATVVPEFDTLHVMYVFASEEYPEYVGSAFNDVMEVRIDGALCSAVPGTNLPVAVNSINQETNSEYYIDNSAGAAGYETTMDGLTVPLSCDIAVTPGEEVEVSIAIADTSDGVWDSAVALVNGGIYAD